MKRKYLICARVEVDDDRDEMKVLRRIRDKINAIANVVSTEPMSDYMDIPAVDDDGTPLGITARIAYVELNPSLENDKRKRARERILKEELAALVAAEGGIR